MCKSEATPKSEYLQSYSDGINYQIKEQNNLLNFDERAGNLSKVIEYRVLRTFMHSATPSEQYLQCRSVE